jgi:hypothetical protein
MNVTLTGVLANGTQPQAGISPLVPYAQPLAWPAGEDGSIVVKVVDPTGAVVNITGGALVLAARHRASDAALAFRLTAVLTTPAQGVATFTLPAATTAALTELVYRYDVWYTDATSKRWQLVPASLLDLAEADLRPGE